MEGSQTNIVRPKLSQIQSQVRPRAVTGDPIIEKFKLEVKDNKDEAFDYIRKNLTEDVKGELLNIAVNSRIKNVVRKVLQRLCITQHQTDSVVSSGDEIHILKKAVLFATFNDDPETLKEILCWAKKRQINLSIREEGEHCPLVFSCLRNYVRCIDVFCEHGYLIELHDEDKEIIEKVLKEPDVATNHYRLYKRLFAGTRHVDQLYKLDTFFGFFNLIKSKERKNPDSQPVERFLRIKAFSNPHYIASKFVQNCRRETDLEEEDFHLCDPIRKSLSLARYAKLLSYYYVQYSQEYLEISKKCESLATSILDHCDSMEDVKTLLEYDFHQTENADNTNWHLALQDHHVSFVSHHYFQNFLWEKLTGKDFHWDNFYFVWKILYYPFSVLIYLMIPVVVLIDALFRKADILYISPDMKRKASEDHSREMSDSSQETGSVSYQSFGSNGDLVIMTPDKTEATEKKSEHAFFEYFRVRIHRPILRIMAHHFIELLFLVSLSLSLLDPLDEGIESQDKREKQFHSYDALTTIFIVSYVFESFSDFCRRKWQSLSSFWQIYNLTNSVLLAVGGLGAYLFFILLEDDNRADLSGNHPVNVSCTLLAIGASLSLLKPLRWFLFSKSLGPVVVCIVKVLKDAFIIFLIFLIVFAAFSISTFSLYKPFSLHDKNYRLHQDDLNSLGGLFGAMFWRVFDAGQPHYAAILRLRNNTNCSGDTNDEDEVNINCISNEFSHLMSMAVWAVYQAITVILLINILIAMMNTTYNRIWESSDTQWKFVKSYHQIQFLFPRAALPPPFRVFYYFVKNTYNRKRTDPDSSINSQQQQFQLYKQTLFQIVKMKVQADLEDSVQDDFNDMRQDLQNFITEKHNTRKQELQEEFNELKSCFDNRESETLKIIKSKDLALGKLEQEVVDMKKLLQDIKKMMKVGEEEKKYTEAKLT